MGFQNVRTITLIDNRLKDIMFKAEDIPSLQYLYLTYNLFRQMPKFYGFFQYLETLWISINLISHVCEEDFENITNIRAVSLVSNGLVSFEPKHELVRLERLYLGYNKLTEVPSLKGMYNNIRLIYIQNNTIPVESLLTLNEKVNGSEHSLIYLSMWGNADLSNSLNDVIKFLKRFNKLKRVLLSKSNINKIFHLTNSLEELDLSHNNISQITKDDFNVTNSHDTFELYLNENPIETLPNMYEYLKDFNSSETVIYLRGIRFHCGNFCWMTKTG